MSQFFCPKNNKLSLGQKKKKKTLALLTSVGLGYWHEPGINTGINICALGPTHLAIYYNNK